MSRNDDDYDSFNDYVKVTMPNFFNDQLKTKVPIPTSESIKAYREIGIKERSKCNFYLNG